MELKIKNIQEIDEAAKEFAKLFSSHRIFAFYGEMGAGKTTFIKALCKQAGVKDNVCSPTFALVYEYNTHSGESIFHFDFYRIKNQSELFDLGYEDYLYSGKICFIEWPELAENLLPEVTVKVKISINPDESRTLYISV
jgi:tRNA threonylcarbamoyladenosine biosynthesis protein TsaE